MARLYREDEDSPQADVRIGTPGKRTRTESLHRRSNALPSAVRFSMERAFDQDFADVSVHEGPEAADVGAIAFTAGNAIHFKPGAYDPHGSEGRRLLAHELTHVVQQRRGGVVGLQAKGGLVNADASLEQEADALGDRAARGERVVVSGVAGMAGIQRVVDQNLPRKTRVKGTHEGKELIGEVFKEVPGVGYKVHLDDSCREAFSSQAFITVKYADLDYENPTTREVVSMNQSNAPAKFEDNRGKPLPSRLAKATHALASTAHSYFDIRDLLWDLVDAGRIDDAKSLLEAYIPKGINVTMLLAKIGTEAAKQPELALFVLKTMIRNNVFDGTGEIISCLEAIAPQRPEETLAFIKSWASKDDSCALYSADIFSRVAVDKQQLASVLVTGRKRTYDVDRDERRQGKILAHSLLDRASPVTLGQENADKLGETEGNSQNASLIEFHRSLAKVRAGIKDLKVAATVDQLLAALDKAIDYAIMLESIANTEVKAKSPGPGLALLIDAVVTAIKKLVPAPAEQPAPLVVVPNGFDKHATLLAITCQANSLYQVVQYNTGSGIERHGEDRELGPEDRKKAKSPTFLEKTEVSAQSVTDQKFWEQESLTGAATDIKPVYDAFDTLDGKERSSKEVDDIYFEVQQSLGFCSWLSITALVRHYLLDTYKSNPREGLMQYKALKALMSAQMFNEIAGSTDLPEVAIETAALKVAERNRYLAVYGPTPTKFESTVEECIALIVSLHEQKFLRDHGKTKLLGAVRHLADEKPSGPEKADEQDRFERLYWLMVDALYSMEDIPVETLRALPKSGDPVVSAILAKWQEERMKYVAAEAMSKE